MEYPEFPDHSRFTPVASILTGAGKGEVTVRGWVYRTRSSGKLAFVVIRDATGILQCTISQAKVPEGDFIAACKALR
ncbi:MAG: OB-fold nucleic acid binding domain-containing protein, partial [Candidatus Thermoplasmatota archaeon]|nr:OB-fold nucleic acid binding domain-containing protein [Candidatus Thermoplasmatota archaeon]